VRAWLSGRGAALALAIGLGLVNALILFGAGPIDPTNTRWIFGDNATYYAGWALYRHDPHLRWPLAFTDRVGYPLGTSIALLDAIPLVAILLRPLSPILPEPFQYLGFYAALCFVLQAYFGISLCRRLCPGHLVYAVIGGTLFLLSPVLTSRASGHTGLLSQWAILAALDAYFRDPGERPGRWLARIWIVLAISTGLTPYVGFMCLLVALAGVGRLLIERRCRWTQAALLSGATVVVAIASGALIGVLVSSDAAAYSASGYANLSMNLNAPVNPMRLGSILLPILRVMPGQQYEGYDYLGLGVIGLLILNVVRRPDAMLSLRERRVMPLLALFVVCTVLALSTMVTLGPRTLFTIAVPRSVESALSALRASGRLFWPAYYLIVLAAVTLTFRIWPARTRVAILAAALAVQYADLIPLRTRVRAMLDQRFDTPLRAAAWQDLAGRYDNLVLLPPHQCAPYAGAGGMYGFVWFGSLAASARLRTNSYYAARYTRAQLYAHCVGLMRAALQGTLDPRSAYVVTDAVRTVWQVRGVRSHRCESVDGFNLCTASDASAPVSGPLPAPLYKVGTVLNLAQSAVGQYRTIGWQEPTFTGTWTEGPLAMVRLGLADADRARPLVLELDAQPLVAPGHSRLDVDVVVNGRPIAHWTFDSPSHVRQQAPIPADLAGARGGLDIEFRILNPETPLYLGTGPSTSFLGFEATALVVR
jgi:hypothetical protein